VCLVPAAAAACNAVAAAAAKGHAQADALGKGVHGHDREYQQHALGADTWRQRG